MLPLCFINPNYKSDNAKMCAVIVSSVEELFLLKEWREVERSW